MSKRIDILYVHADLPTLLCSVCLMSLLQESNAFGNTYFLTLRLYLISAPLKHPLQFLLLIDAGAL